VLCGHLHKFSLLVRATPGGGRLVQMGLSSVLNSLDVRPSHRLSGVPSYGPDQVTVEPAFSPATEAQRRAVYVAEAPLVKHFEYADAPGYALVTVSGAQVTAQVYPGASPGPWRTVDLAQLLEKG